MVRRCQSDCFGTSTKMVVVCGLVVYWPPGLFYSDVNFLGHRYTAPGTPGGEGEKVRTRSGISRICLLTPTGIKIDCGQNDCRISTEHPSSCQGQTCKDRGSYQGFYHPVMLIMTYVARRLLYLVSRSPLVSYINSRKIGFVSRTQPQNFVAKHFPEVCPWTSH